ncbi:hypothetical protein A3Q56_08135 [Intoshia linei]|uniref:Uncharacterized protein n=1 Tax=Intoshia linei TaxID=1819745 RepID=A0A177AQ95_9BILA|nr:hypothetical protein A3Q56_08135 [Intoshia linei]
MQNFDDYVDIMLSHHPDKLKDDLRAKIMRNLAGEIAMD